MLIVGIVVLLLLAFALGVGGYTFFAACSRKDLDWLNEQEAKKTPFGKFFPAIQMGHQWLQDHHAQDLFTTSHDGLKLHASWVPAEKPKGTIILVHGYQSCVLTDFSVAFPLYHEMGWNLLLPSQRAHGKSEGKFTTFGVLESRDMLRWIAYHNAHFGQQTLLLSGLSMGASTVMYLADEPLPENVKGFIADCGFTTPKEIISHVFYTVAHIPAWTVIWATELFARVFGKFSLSDKNSVQTLAKNTRPILMVHGMEDTFVPCHMTRRSYEACSGDKRLLLVKDATHGISFLKAQQQYTAMVQALMEDCLEEKL